MSFILSFESFRNTNIKKVLYGCAPAIPTADWLDAALSISSGTAGYRCSDIFCHRKILLIGI